VSQGKGVRGMQQSYQLEPISEERPLRKRVQRKAAVERAQEETEEEAPASDGLIDKLADDIFAAFESAFGAQKGGGSSTTDEDESDEDDGLNEGKLLWRPDLELPGQNSRRIFDVGKYGAGKSKGLSTAEDLIGDKQSGMAKLLNVPPPDRRAADRASRQAAPDTAGKSWFHLPATEITDEVKADLRVLRLRSAFDPKKFYKKFDNSKFPKHFQFGTVVEGPTDFYSSRLTRKERKRTLAEEVMADPHLTEVRKKRYGRMQEEAAAWSSGPRGRKTDNPRLKKKPHRAKH